MFYIQQQTGSSKKDKALKKFIQENKEKNKEETLVKIFETSHAERYFYTDKNGVCNQFNGYIESVGVLKPEHIFSECLNILLDKIKTFKTNIDNVITKNMKSDKIEIYLSPDNMKAYEIKVNDETHTLGNIIQTYASNIYDIDKLLLWVTKTHIHSKII